MAEVHGLFLGLILLAAVEDLSAGPHEERLINDIFDKAGKNYQMLARPTEIESEAVEVQFGLTLMQIIKVDEKNEFLHTNMWLNYEWKDYKLSWNESDYGGVKSIRLPVTKIWTPDILLYNRSILEEKIFILVGLYRRNLSILSIILLQYMYLTINPKGFVRTTAELYKAGLALIPIHSTCIYIGADEDIDSKFPTNVVVYSDGRCTWIPLGLYISACPIDITWFPFDDQYCTLKFGSWTYDGNSINLTMLTADNKSSVDLSSYQPSGEWDLIEVPAIRNVKTYDCCPEQYIDITFTIHIRRRTLYYGFNLIIPCALISMLTLLVFILPPDEGEKIGLGITILLSLSVFQLIVAEMVPATSMAVPLVGVYFASIMFMCTISIIMTVLVLNFHHRSPDMYVMPIWVKRLICEWLAWILRMSRPGRDLTHKVLLRKARLRELEAKTPPSLSLISNVKDVDNHIPLMSSMHDFSNFRSVSVDGDGPRNNISGGGGDHCGHNYGSSGAFGSIGVRNELLAILNELRFITKRMKDDVERSDETNDWKFAAMVIDRLCFYIFTAYLVLATAGIFISPHMVSRKILGAHAETGS